MTTDTTFFDILRGSLIPNMMPFNGTNPNSIIIMDNCSVHIEEVRELLVLFLPPYSPDLNPLEETFRGYLRKHDELFQSIPFPSDLVKTVFLKNTVRHGYLISLITIIIMVT